jgi:hypothetical protein
MKHHGSDSTPFLKVNIGLGRFQVLEFETPDSYFTILVFDQH